MLSSTANRGSRGNLCQSQIIHGWRPLLQTPPQTFYLSIPLLSYKYTMSRDLREL